MTVSLNIEQTLGAAAVGFFFSCVVYGILTSHVFIYFQRFPYDKLGYKILVGGLWLLELIDQIFIGYSIYFYSVTHFLSPSVMATDPVIWTLILQVVMGCLVATVVKCCFAMRVWRFSKKNPYITSGIVFMILVQMGFAVLYCVRAFQLQRVIHADKLRGIASIALTTGLITDFAIAAALCYFLAKLRTGFKSSDTLITRLTIYAVNTGMLTGAMALLTVIVYNAKPETFYFMATYFSVGKLYAISFICALNTRKSVRGRGTDQNSESGAVNSANKHSRGHSNIVHTLSAGRTPSDFPAPAPYTLAGKMEIGIHQEIAVLGENASIDKTGPSAARGRQVEFRRN